MVNNVDADFYEISRGDNFKGKNYNDVVDKKSKRSNKSKIDLNRGIKIGSKAQVFKSISECCSFVDLDHSNQLTI